MIFCFVFFLFLFFFCTIFVPCSNVTFMFSLFFKKLKSIRKNFLIFKIISLLKLSHNKQFDLSISMSVSLSIKLMAV